MDRCAWCVEREERKERTEDRLEHNVVFLILLTGGPLEVQTT